MRNHSNENDFDFHENGRAGKRHLHMNGFARRLVLKQRQSVTRKWPITRAFFQSILAKALGTVENIVKTQCKPLSYTLATKKCFPAHQPLFWMASVQNFTPSPKFLIIICRSWISAQVLEYEICHQIKCSICKSFSRDL